MRLGHKHSVMFTLAALGVGGSGDQASATPAAHGLDGQGAVRQIAVAAGPGTIDVVESAPVNGVAVRDSPAHAAH